MPRKSKRSKKAAESVPPPAPEAPAEQPEAPAEQPASEPEAPAEKAPAEQPEAGPAPEEKPADPPVEDPPAAEESGAPPPRGSSGPRSAVGQPTTRFEKENKEDKIDEPVTEESLDAEERGEKRPHGFADDPFGFNQLVGVTFCHVNHCAGWIMNRQYVHVARWYMHKRIAIDFGVSRRELEARAEFFKTTDVAYVFVASDERLDEKQMRGRIEEAIDARDKRKHS